MNEYLERESKWDVDVAFEVPGFDDLSDDVRVARSTIDLTSTYFDTSDLDLLARGLTLRQRVGGDDNGWQLKVPADDGRTEIRAELSDTLPAELTELIKGVCLGKDLGVVATIHTTRHRDRLLTAEGELVAEVADDHVVATTPSRPGEKFVWREIEVEAGPAGDDLSKITDRLVQAGATASAHPAKLTRALRIDRRSEPKSGFVEGYLRKQIDAVFAGDIGLRRRTDPIHDTRVAVRRLRSTLRVFRKSFDSPALGGLEAELKWFGTEMGGVRDCHVRRRRFSSAIRELDPKLVIGSVRRHLDHELATRQHRARSELAAAMNSVRYFALLAVLQRWSTTPPIGSDATAKSLRKQARRAARKADRRFATALASGNDAELHRARKAAKRARYAYELLASTKKAKRYKRIQRVLGENQDSVVARETLLDVASMTGSSIPNTFTLGVLYVHEMKRGARAREAARRL